MSQRVGETKQEAADRINAERRARYADDPEWRAAIREDERRRRSDPDWRDRQNAVQRERRRTKTADPERRREEALKRRARVFNITIGELEQMLLDGCGICGVRDPNLSKNLHVDHDHECCPGQGSCGRCVRGVLCYRDNATFERFLDSPRVIAYLCRTPAGRATLARSGQAPGSVVSSQTIP